MNDQLPKIKLYWHRLYLVDYRWRPPWIPNQPSRPLYCLTRWAWTDVISFREIWVLPGMGVAVLIHLISIIGRRLSFSCCYFGIQYCGRLVSILILRAPQTNYFISYPGIQYGSHLTSISMVGAVVRVWNQGIAAGISHLGIHWSNPHELWYGRWNKTFFDLRFEYPFDCSV
jgi:hypothetical protein